MTYIGDIGVRFRNSILTSLSLCTYMYFELCKWLDIKGRRIFARPISIERNRVILRVGEKRAKERERERKRFNDSNTN